MTTAQERFETYKLAHALVLDQGRTIWSTYTLFFAGNALLLRNIDDVEKVSCFVYTILGIAFTLLWALILDRQWRYYRVRLEQARSLEQRLKNKLLSPPIPPGPSVESLMSFIVFSLFVTYSTLLAFYVRSHH